MNRQYSAVLVVTICHYDNMKWTGVNKYLNSLNRVMSNQRDELITRKCHEEPHRCSIRKILWSFNDDVIRWKHFPRYWSFVRGIHRSTVNSPHNSQWRGALMFLWCAPWINGWVNNREAGDLRRHRTHYDVIGMLPRAHELSVIRTEAKSNVILPLCSHRDMIF